MHKIDINFRESALFILALLLVIFCGLLVIRWLPVALGWRAGLALWVIGYGAKIGWDHGLLKGRQAILGLRNDEAGWWLRTRDGWHRADLCGDSTVTLLISILRFKAPYLPRKQTVLVFRDSLLPDGYRRLIVQLRTNTALRAEQKRHSAHLSNALDV